jgi:1,4-dihydroxy-2-naphthoyl-CoA hydrolase
MEADNEERPNDPRRSPIESMSAPPDAQALVAMMPFTAACGVAITGATPDGVTAELAWAPERCTSAGILHGGAIMTLADSLGGICAFLNLPEGAATSTIESKTNFFRAVRSGAIHGTTSPLHVGRTTIVVQTDVRDDRGRRVALVTQTQAVLPQPT